MSDNDVVFRKKDFLGNPLKSRALKEILKNEDVAKILDKNVEQRQFVEKLKSYASNSKDVTQEEVRAALADLKYKTGDSLTFKETIKLGNALGAKDLSRKDLAADSDLRKKGGVFGSVGYGQANASKRPPLRGLPF
ncbi:MAG: hypothetical protein IPN70_05280 [Candidatus Moraniibacteriota bacterium]|nr:MAG: hypothetical protein IPN70_05280 [Candidatus Moranbacteria bacterium]